MKNPNSRILMNKRVMILIISGLNIRTNSKIGCSIRKSLNLQKETISML